VTGIFLPVRWPEFKVNHDLLKTGDAYRNREPYVVLGGQSRRSRKGSSETGHDLLWGTRHVAASFFHFRRQSRCASGSTARPAARTRRAADTTPNLTGSHGQPDKEFFDFCRNLRPLRKHGESLTT